MLTREMYRNMAGVQIHVTHEGIIAIIIYVTTQRPRVTVEPGQGRSGTLRHREEYLRTTGRKYTYGIGGLP